MIWTQETDISICPLMDLLTLIPVVHRLIFHPSPPAQHCLPSPRSTNTLLVCAGEPRVVISTKFELHLLLPHVNIPRASKREQVVITQFQDNIYVPALATVSGLKVNTSTPNLNGSPPPAAAPRDRAHPPSAPSPRDRRSPERQNAQPHKAEASSRRRTTRKHKH